MLNIVAGHTQSQSRKIEVRRLGPHDCKTHAFKCLSLVKHQCGRSGDILSCTIIETFHLEYTLPNPIELLDESHHIPLLSLPCNSLLSFQTHLLQRPPRVSPGDWAVSTGSHMQQDMVFSWAPPVQHCSTYHREKSIPFRKSFAPTVCLAAEGTYASDYARSGCARQ